MFFDFDTNEGEKIKIKMALSPVSSAGALENMKKEVPGWDFEKVKKQSQDVWNKELNKIQIETIQKEGKGAVIFINQEVKTFNLLKRLHEIKKLQSEGVYEIPQIPMDTKDFGIGAQILHDLNISKIRLITNSGETKRVGMIGYGLEITEYVKY